jgi:hypothetical protein
LHEQRRLIGYWWLKKRDRSNEKNKKFAKTQSKLEKLATRSDAPGGDHGY